MWNRIEIKPRETERGGKVGIYPLSRNSSSRRCNSSRPWRNIKWQIGTTRTRNVQIQVQHTWNSSRDRQTGRDIERKARRSKGGRGRWAIKSCEAFDYYDLVTFYFRICYDPLSDKDHSALMPCWNRYVHIDEVAEGGNGYCGSEVTRVLTVDKKDDDAEYWIYKFVNIMTLTFGFGFPFTYTYTCVFCSVWVNT